MIVDYIAEVSVFCRNIDNNKTITFKLRLSKTELNTLFSHQKLVQGNKTIDIENGTITIKENNKESLYIINRMFDFFNDLRRERHMIEKLHQIYNIIR